MASPASKVNNNFPQLEPVGFRPVRKRQAPAPCACCKHKVQATAKNVFDQVDPEIEEIVMTDHEVAAITSQQTRPRRNSKVVVLENAHLTIRVKRPSKT